MDFTIPLTNSFATVVVPLKVESNIWFFIDPFSYWVWIGLLISIPIYLITMGLTNYLFGGDTHFDEVTVFILRNALSEQNATLPNHGKAYQKLLIMTWIWCMLILVQSYAGNLTAMLAKPQLQDPIRTIEDLLSQDKIPWAIADGSPEQYFLSNYPPGSVLRRLNDHARIMNVMSTEDHMMYGCFTKDFYQRGDIGVICLEGGFYALVSNDFSNTGRCNYYMLEDKFLTSGAAMAFQVTLNCLFLDIVFFLELNFRKIVLSWMISITL